ncbi:hypothetical protein ABZT45_49690 [Streptomyces sp. NPDC005356]|uniref:hypothetical protein n=1 Tax=unclassified Streptomyces TaxID=2593676 RepID=UPI0033A3C7C8
MIAIAVLLLPAMGVLLFAMDRVEDRLSARWSRARHARGGALRLVHGANLSGVDRRPAGHSPRRLDAA